MPPKPARPIFDLSRQGQTWLREITARIETPERAFSLSDPRYQISQGSEPANDAFGKEPSRIIAATDVRGVMDLRLGIRQNDRGDVLVKLWCKNRTDKPIRIRNLVVLDAFRPGVWEGGRALGFGALHGVSSLRKGLLAGGALATAANRPAFSGAFVATSHYRGIVNLIPVEGGLKVTAIDQADDVLLPAGASRESEPVWLSAGAHPSDELERFGDLAGAWNHCRIFPDNFATWCTYYGGMNNYLEMTHTDQLERFVVKNLRALAKYLPLGLDCIRVVNCTVGRVPGDWPMVSPQIPHGLPALVGQMRRFGFRPGGYCDMNDIVVASEAYKKHPDWAVRRADGKPDIHIEDPTNTYMGDFCRMDTSVDGALEHFFQTAPLPR